MKDFLTQREAMVQQQLVSRGISDARVLNAFRKVPRHKFVPSTYIDEAYCDYPLPIGKGQTISQPYMVALMTECLCVKKSDRILEIGTGSGYQSAILAELAGEVYTIERIESLAHMAEENLRNVSYKNVRIKIDDGTLGWPNYAPYDGIIITAGAPRIPKSLLSQLKEGGRMVIPLGDRFSQELTIVYREKGKISKNKVCGCIFVPLIGEEGWEGNLSDR